MGNSQTESKGKEPLLQTVAFKLHIAIDFGTDGLGIYFTVDI